MSVYTRGFKLLLVRQHVSSREFSLIPRRSLSTKFVLEKLTQTLPTSFLPTRKMSNDAPKVTMGPESSIKAPTNGRMGDDLDALTRSINMVSISKGVNTTMSTPSQPARTPLPSSMKSARTPLPSSAASSQKKSSHRSRKGKHKNPDSSPSVSVSAKQINGLKTDGRRGRMPRQETAKVAPSLASGGIPNPSPEYLYRANHIPQTLSVAQNLLVVIDLNGTILYRPSRSHPTDFVARPNALRFLEYCIETFSVVIWSSARPQNVDAMIRSIIPLPLCRKVVAIWARDKFNLTLEDYNSHVQCYKRLTYLWQDPRIAYSHPEYSHGYRWDQTNTVLVDDSIEKGRSEPYNLIEIPEFLGAENEPRDILPQVHDHLNYLSMHSDVSACLKMYPFRAMSAPFGPADYVAKGVGPLPVFQQSLQQ
jgi:hypothetical protein